jgi:hypothetical protein
MVQKANLAEIGRKWAIWLCLAGLLIALSLTVVSYLTYKDVKPAVEAIAAPQTQQLPVATKSLSEVKWKLREITYDDYIDYIRGSDTLMTIASKECLQNKDFCPKRIIVRLNQKTFSAVTGCVTACNTAVELVLKTDDGRVLPVGSLSNHQETSKATNLETLIYSPVTGFSFFGTGIANKYSYTDKMTIDSALFYLLVESE